jgi:hypothetical protein
MPTATTTARGRCSARRCTCSANWASLLASGDATGYRGRENAADGGTQPSGWPNRRVAAPGWPARPPRPPRRLGPAPQASGVGHPGWRPLASRSSKPATVGRDGSSRRWLPALVLMLAVLVAGLTLGRALWPGAATPRVVRGTITAVGPERTQIGPMPDGHRDPDPLPSLRERVTDWRYGFRNTFTGYEVGGVPWADAEGAWAGRPTGGARSGPGAARRRRPPRRSGRRLVALPIAGSSRLRQQLAPRLRTEPLATRLG